VFSGNNSILFNFLDRPTKMPDLYAPGNCRKFLIANLLKKIKAMIQLIFTFFRRGNGKV